MSRRTLFCLALSFLIANTSNAQFGSLLEAIDAARENREPAYIEPLMIELSKKLNSYVSEEKVHPSNEGAYWMATTGEFVDVVCQAALLPVKTVGGDGAVNAVKNAAVLQNWLLFGGMKSFFDYNIKTGAIKAGFDAANLVLKYVDASREETARIVFRAGEWAALNYMFENIESFLQFVHKQKARQGFGTRKLENEADWIAFYREYFLELSPEAMLYLTPWLSQVFPVVELLPQHKDVFLRVNPPKDKEIILKLFWLFYRDASTR